ncbi:MAG TPA: N-acetylmuramic acid 6-phosphate etherase [Tepidisphaeraceae bacterium]|jgi:N-acetylmuramic acid 6-phosphate etherase
MSDAATPGSADDPRRGNRGDMLTERRLAESQALDRMSAGEIVAVMNAQDAVAVAAVAAIAADVARAVEIVAERLARGGRLIYAGAGTSGRLGVLDASECPPTFGVPAGVVVGLIAGGPEAVFKAREGAEDSANGGAAMIAESDVTEADTVCGIAAGGTTPFVAGALAEARRRGAATLFLTCVRAFDGEPAADVVLRPLTGAEVLTGSTRLKAGTATKLVLNQLSTAAMVRLGKCYENWMVDLRVTNAKLRERAERIVMAVSGATREQAAALLAATGDEVKTAVVAHRFGCPPAQAREKLAAASGRLRDALAS